MNSLGENRLLSAVFIPVIFTGIIVAFIVIRTLIPPLAASFHEQTDKALHSTSDMAVAICEERFNDLLELRMEENAVMDAAYMQEAVQQIKSIRRIHPGIRILILQDKVNLLDKTKVFDDIVDLKSTFSYGSIVESSMLGEPAHLLVQYFPYWNFHIICLISVKDYNAPIHQAWRIVFFGTFGVLLSVLVTLLLLFLWRITKPLQKIIVATNKIANGELVQAEVNGRDEIAQVGRAFNAMVHSLDQDQQKIHKIMGELRDSEEQYRILTENTLAYIVVLRNNRVLYVNSRMLASLQAEKSKVMAGEFTSLIHPEDRQVIEEIITELENGKIDEKHMECRLQTIRGEPFWIELQANLILYQETPAVLIHGIDITVRKKEQQEREKLEHLLVQAKKMEAIGTLAGGVAHDLNNILSGLVGYPELLMLKLDKNDPMYATLETIHTSGKKAAEIVQDLLALARRGVVIEEVVNLNTVIDEYLNSPQYFELCKRHGDIVFSVDQDPELMNIIGSPVHLLKTVMNLVANAVESIPDAGEVHIKAKNYHLDTAYQGLETIPPNDYVVFSVSDNGTGIAEQDLGRVFEPFFTKKAMKHSGTGLGMTVIWGTTHDHNGFIDIDSTLTTGTTIDLYFPVSRQPLASQLELERDTKQYLGAGEKILVVDDIPEQLQLLEAMLRLLNYQPYSVSSGEACLEFLEKQQVNLVILDMIMTPGMDGLETFKRIQALHPEQKAIIASGFSETDRVEEAINLGALGYVRKPFTLKRISKVIREALAG